MVIILYTNIANAELSHYHRKINSVLNIKIEELDDNPLFIIEENGNLLKIIPLFNCEEIISSNVADRVLDNMCIICENNPDTILNFNTNKQHNKFKLYYAHGNFSYYYKGFNGVVYDSENYTPLSNVELIIEFLTNNEVSNTLKTVTDSNGNFGAIFRNWNYTDIRITAKYENITKTFYNMEEISDGV